MQNEDSTLQKNKSLSERYSKQADLLKDILEGHSTSFDHFASLTSKIEDFTEVVSNLQDLD